MIFASERLIARAWTSDDVDAAFDIYSDPDVLRYLGDGSAAPVRSKEQMRASLEAWEARETTDGLGMWALERKDGGVVVGSVLLALLEGGPEVELGYHLAKRAWGNGYATEAAIAALQHGFDRLALSRIVAVVYPENVASRRVLERAGMRHEGRRHHYGHDLEFFVAERNG